MIRFQIVNLFPKEKCPEIFTDEFDGVQGCLRTGFEDTVAVKKKDYLDLDLDKYDDLGGMGERKVRRGRERGINLPFYKALSNTISKTI